MSEAGQIDQLNFGLAGSPYSLPSDDDGIRKSLFVIEKLQSIEARQRVVETEFAAESQQIRDQLDSMLGARQVYESNKLESAGLSLEATNKAIQEAPSDLAALARYMAEQRIRSDRHLMEVLGLRQAMVFAQQLAVDFHNSQLSIREIDLRNLHRFTLPLESFAGSYKSQDVTIAGTDLRTSNIADVEEHVRELVRWLNQEEVSPPLAATVVHSWLTIIHPFLDGNGRVARLLANLVLMKANWPALIVRASDRLQYLDALSESDSGGNILPLFDLFARSIELGLRELEQPDLARRLFEADLQLNPDRRYEIWCGLLDMFMDSLRRRLREGDWDLNRLGLPSASSYQLIEQKDSSGNTWLAKIRSREGHDFLIWMGFPNFRMEDYAPRPPDAPSLFISERDRRPDAVRSYRNPFEFTQLSVDEITIVPTLDEKPVMMRYDLTVVERTVETAAEVLAKELFSARAD